MILKKIDIYHFYKLSLRKTLSLNKNKIGSQNTLTSIVTFDIMLNYYLSQHFE